MVIAKSTGVIEGILNFSELKKEITKDENWDENNSVLNGIAYHKERKSFFITGKNWNKIFEVRISTPSE
ncbi:MAG: glutaminyl-peptide cyclotransferase [Flavobacteriaceae bacterium]